MTPNAGIIRLYIKTTIIILKTTEINVIQSVTRTTFMHILVTTTNALRLFLPIGRIFQAL